MEGGKKKEKFFDKCFGEGRRLSKFVNGARLGFAKSFRWEEKRRRVLLSLDFFFDKKKLEEKTSAPSSKFGASIEKAPE